MDEYISRETALDMCDDDGDIIRIRNIPAADVRPVVRGKWLATAGWGKDKCSNCGFVIDWDDVPAWLDKAPHFSETCPNCGADMRQVKLMAKADGLLPKFLHFQSKIKYTEDQNIKVQLENVSDHDWVEVVRCQDCVHYAFGDCLSPFGLDHPNFTNFCSGGRRKSNDTDSSDPSKMP